MHVPLGLLRRHVLESNLIENIVAKPGTPTYDGHMEAARTAAGGAMVSPNHLHFLLMRQIPGFRFRAGQYRTCGAMVGDRHMPRWQMVPRLMDDWFGLVGQCLRAGHEPEYSAYILHVWLLCIHPWPDGNGRTARLVWNMLRTLTGLPWHIESACGKGMYYAKIRAIEDWVFKKQHPDVY